MKKTLITFAGAIVLLLLLSGWGYTGHYTIAEQAGKSLNRKIKGFDQWVPFITEHSSDPDYRKFWIKTESPKHYIDLDNYPEFVSGGSIVTNYDSLAKLHDETFITEQGTLPWATLAAFDSLRSCFERKDWYRAKHWASDLSHYVGDGYMPLHATRNYDGQDSGNKGIHIRYESKMITAFANDIKWKVKPPRYINDIPSFIFSYIYKSNQLCDSIFHADNRAKQLAGDIDSPEYLSALWVNTADLTIDQLSKASFALECLIFTAWKQAGSPNLKAPSSSTDNGYDCEIISILQNPDSARLTINYRINKLSTYKLDVRNSDGGPLLKAGKWDKEPGTYTTDIDISSLTTGSYLVELDGASIASTVKFFKK